MADEIDFFCAAFPQKIYGSLNIVRAISKSFMGFTCEFPSISLFEFLFDFFDTAHFVMTAVAEKEDGSIF